MKFDIEKMRIEMKKNDAKRDAGLVEPTTIEKFRDISYGPHGIDNTLDVYYPKETDHKLPTLIHIHGGGFFYRDKELYRFYTMFLASQGFTVINFNYRLAPDHVYPTHLKTSTKSCNGRLKTTKITLSTWISCFYSVTLQVVN